MKAILKCSNPRGHCWVNCGKQDGNNKRCKHCFVEKFWSHTRCEWVLSGKTMGSPARNEK